MALQRMAFDATDEAGNILTNVQVEVRRESDNALVSLYSDRAGTVSIGNPVTFADGKVYAHVAAAAYKVTLTKGAYTRTLRYVPVGTAQELDYSAVGANLLNATDEAAARTAISVREKLTANRTYYVRTDGSNSNTGLANTSGGAFLTIQKAIDVVFGTLDLGGFNVTINVADGTYTGNIVQASPQIGAGSVSVVGNNGTPANVVLSTSTGCILISNQTVLSVSGVTLTSSGGSGASVDSGAVLNLSSFVCGACSTYHLVSLNNSSLNLLSNYTITGSAQRHYSASYKGYVFCQSRTITLIGTPAFSSGFAVADYLSILRLKLNTYSGAATGARYGVSTNAIITSGGGGASYFPGNAAGSASTGGVYE